MRILFTTSDNPLSKVIRATTDEPVSHVAIEIYRSIVIHSNLKGVNMVWSSTFRKQNRILFELEPSSRIDHLAKLENLMESDSDAGYDFGALLYLGLKLGFKKIGINLPKKNLWQSTGMYICTEWVNKIIDDKEDAMITPYRLYEKLKNSGKWKDV